MIQLLLEPGDAVWIEEPGYPGLRGPLIAAGATPVPVPLDREGLRVDEGRRLAPAARSEEHTSELQSLMRISYAVFCLKKKKHHIYIQTHNQLKSLQFVTNSLTFTLLFSFAL